MRNLQKILALVLALIMSFSLVATAGAFSDDGDISDAYQDAVTVLNGLEVFKGYSDGTFAPKGNITRAEVAAIIYRIATGDVNDTQASIYSTYGQFTDVADGSWYSGYVNYCANAGYIKGRGNKIFDPQGQVTGYEALAMILRAVGYDKNGEFTGSNWQIRTASIANERGISKNVTSAMLGQAATREMVAELLFRSIIVPKVNFNANTLSYTEKPLNADGKKDTLGYESLKLEEITGIVTANEYADLENTITLNDGKTRMRVDGVDGSNYTLDYAEDNLLDGLDAIGEEHNAYIQNANTTSAKVLVMAKTDKNKTFETLDEVEIDTDSKFREKTGFQRGSATEDFLNFDEVNEWHSDWRIKYVVSSISTVADNVDEIKRMIASINVNTGFNLPELGTRGVVKANGEIPYDNGYTLIPNDADGKYFIEYTKEFRIDDLINSVHRGNIEEIFNIADKLYANNYVRGEVYVGTSSLKDISDEISFKQFVDQYIDNTEAKITDNENGNWLKVIDNDNDGQADYVLKVVYTMAQVVRAKDGKYGLDTEDRDLCDKDQDVNYLDDDDVVSEDTLALDDIVYYAIIDEVPHATKAETASVKIDVVNRKDLKVTTTDGTEYVESGVCGVHVLSNDYTCGVVNMNGSATYDIYLDRGGYLALFTDSHGGDYTLIVDGWYNSTKNGIEYAVRAYDDETGRQNVVDVTRGGAMFIDSVLWDGKNVLNNDWGALKWLGGTTAIAPDDNSALSNVKGTDNHAGKLNGEGVAVRDAAGNITGYDNDVKTTVATLTEDGIIQPVDYASVGDKHVAMLATNDNTIPTSAASYGATVYTTGVALSGTSSAARTDTAYNNGNPDIGTAELRALSNTIYYLVYPSRNAESGYVVERYVGYDNVPSIDKGFVEDVYAVGTRQTRSSTLGATTYYTADVVVVELRDTYKGRQEQVFIYNMPEAGSKVGIETVDLIRENGSLETVKVDFNASNIRDYRVALNAASGWNTWGPGLYYLYTTSTDGLYTVQPMSAADIAANDYVVGWSATAQGTLKNDYVSLVAFDKTQYPTPASYNGLAYALVEKAAASSNIYTLEYDNNGIATLGSHEATAGNIQRYLGERTEVNAGSDYAPYEHHPLDGHNCTDNWNQNRILIHYDGNKALYAISFSNKVNSVGRLAQMVWDSNRPDDSIWKKNADSVLSFARFVAEDYQGVNEKVVNPETKLLAKQALENLVYNDLSASQKTLYDRLWIKLGGTVVDPNTYTITVNYIVDNGEATTTAPEGVTVDGATTGLTNGTHTLTLTVDHAKYTVNTDSELKEDIDNSVTVNGADVTVTVRLTSVGSEQPGTDVTLKLDPNFATWVWNDINDKTAGKTEFAIQASAAVKAVDGKATINPKTVVSNWTEGFVAEDAGDWNIELATNDSSVATFNYDSQMIELTGAAEGTELTIGLVCLKGPAWITETNTEDPGGSTVNPGGGFDRPGGFNSRARIARAGEGEPQKFIRGEKYPYYFILPSTMTIQSITVNEVDYDVDTITKVGEGNTPETAGQTLYSIELTYTGGNYRIGVTVTENPTDVVPVTLGLNGVPESVDTIKVNGEARVPAGNQADAVKDEDGTYTATFAVELPANYKIRFNGGTAEQDTTAAGNVWNLTVTAAEADKESGKNVLATVIPGLLVEAAAQDTVLFKDESYRRTVIELQGTDLMVDENYKVTGTVKYNENWGAYSGDDANGYFVALKVAYPGKAITSITLVKDDGTDKAVTGEADETVDGQDYVIVVKRLKLKNNVPEPITIKANGETYTIDVSGVTLVKDGVSSNLVVEAATDTDYANNDVMLGDDNGRKTVKELQDDITAVDNNDSTWTVAGVSNYVTEFTAWDGSNANQQKGNYIALKLSYPGVKAADIKVVSSDNAAKPLSKDGTTADGDEYGILVWRITWQANGNAKPITVKAGGKTYTIKLNVTNGDPNESLYVTGAVDGDVAEDDSIIGADGGRKTIAQLQSDVTADFVDSTGTIKVHGTVNYVTGFTAWSESEKNGYYIALQFAHDTVENDEITVDSSDDDEKPLGDDGILIWKIDGKKKPEERLIKVTAQGKTYTVDLSGVTLAEAGELILKPMIGTIADADFDDKDISVLQNIKLVPDGDSRFVAEGTIFYNRWTKGFGEIAAGYNPGWYIALNLYAPGSTPKVYNTAANGEDNWTEITDGELIWLIGNENKKATEIKIQAYDKLYTIDLGSLKFDTALEVTAGKGTDGKYYERPVSDIQDIDVSVDEATKTVKVSGTAYYQDNWTGWSSVDALNDGYFIALHFATPGNGYVVVKNGLNENAKKTDLNGNDLVLKVGGADEDVLSPDRTFVIVKDNDDPDTGVIQVYTLDLSDLDFVDVNGQSDVAAYAMDDIGYEELNDVTEWVVE